MSQSRLCSTQVDVFSFGVMMYEVLERQVTSAVVSQAGDMTMPEMYAEKVSNSFCVPCEELLILKCRMV